MFQSEPLQVNQCLNQQQNQRLDQLETGNVIQIKERRGFLLNLSNLKFHLFAFPPLTVRDSTQAPVTTFDWGEQIKN